MRKIGILPTMMHGVMDYLVGILLLISPWFIGFYQGGAETIVPVCLGIVTIIYSLMTNYELGVFRVISMRTHLVIDFLSGMFLAASPWLFGFAADISLPHLAIGIFEMVAALITNRQPAFFNRAPRGSLGEHAH